MKRNGGFTLIELVIVIVILGILAAAALPRFSDLTGNARTAAVNGIAGALRASAAITHATQLAKGYSQGQSVVLEGVSITMSNGYPIASATPVGTGSVVSALTDYSGFTLNGSATAVTFSARDNCVAEYVAATNSVTAATVSVTTTGCSS